MRGATASHHPRCAPPATLTHGDCATRRRRPPPLVVRRTRRGARHPHDPAGPAADGQPAGREARALCRRTPCRKLGLRRRHGRSGQRAGATAGIRRGPTGAGPVVTHHTSQSIQHRHGRANRPALRARRLVRVQYPCGRPRGRPRLRPDGSGLVQPGALRRAAERAGRRARLDPHHSAQQDVRLLRAPVDVGGAGPLRNAHATPALAPV